MAPGGSVQAIAQPAAPGPERKEVGWANAVLGATLGGLGVWKAFGGGGKQG